MLTKYLHTVTFQEDGNIVASYSSTGKEGENTVSGLRMEQDMSTLESDGQKESFYPADGIFVALGTAGSTEIARQMGAELTEKGNIKVNQEMETTIPGLFAAGVLFGTAGIKALSSKDAKKLYTNCTAAVLRAKKVVMDTVTTIQENAEDIYADAKQINEEREAAEEAVEDVAEETAEEAVEAEAEDTVEA